MSIAIERLVNLALCLAANSGPVARERIRTEVEGYPNAAEQDEDAFLRMFERDKDALRDAGFSIGSDAQGRYWLDSAATFSSSIALTADESAAVSAVGAALLDDPAFPFSEDLRFALAKVATAIQAPDAPALARTVDERPADQGLAVALLDQAATNCKTVTFTYTNSYNENKAHTVEPYGLFVRDGRWYIVGRDADIDEVRVYAIARIEDLVANSSRPKSPDFACPRDFDVRRFIGLPFQYGTESSQATIRFEPEVAWRAPSLTAGAGQTRQLADGAVEWTVTYSDRTRLLRWIIENGPGLSPTCRDLQASLVGGLHAVETLHSDGGDS